MQAKKETVDKVCGIVKKQLALGDDQKLCAESKFSDLGADSLDTVDLFTIMDILVFFFLFCFDIGVVFYGDILVSIKNVIFLNLE